MKKIGIRIIVAVLALQASTSYLPYSAHAIDTETALMCRTAKLAMRSQVDELNKKTSAVRGDHWKQYAQVMVESFDTSAATDRLSVVKNMWVQVMSIQKQYVDQFQKSVESSEKKYSFSDQKSYVSAIQDILDKGTDKLVSLSNNSEKLISWRKDFLSLIPDSKTNYFQGIDAVVAYNNKYGSICGSETLPIKDSTDQNSMNRMANTQVVLSASSAAATTPIQCVPEKTLVEPYQGGQKEFTAVWNSYKSDFSEEMTKYFSEPEVQVLLTKAYSTPAKLGQNLLSVAEKAQKIYLQSVSVEKPDYETAKKVFLETLYNAPQLSIAKVLGESVYKWKWFTEFVSYWHQTSEAYVEYANQFVQTHMSYAAKNNCIAIVLPSNPLHSVISSIFSKISITKAPVSASCSARAGLATELTNTSQSSVKTVALFMKAYPIATIFDANSLKERQKAVAEYSATMKQLEQDYISQYKDTRVSTDFNKDLSMVSEAPLLKAIDAEIMSEEKNIPMDVSKEDSEGANAAMNAYYDLASTLKDYVVPGNNDKNITLYDKFLNALNTSTNLAPARDAYRTIVAKVYAFNATAKENNCSPIPVPKVDPLHAALTQVFVASSSTNLLQTFGMQAAVGQANVSQDPTVQMQCFQDSSNLIALQNKALTTSKLKWFGLLSTLTTSTNNKVFDTSTLSDRKKVAIAYLTYMRKFRDNFVSDYTTSLSPTLIQSYATTMADGIMGVFGVMSKYINTENEKQWNTFVEQAKKVASETKADFIQVISAYVDFNAANEGQCAQLSLPLQDTVDTSFASFFQK